MTKPEKPRNEIKSMIIERVNAQAPDKIVGIEILPVIGRQANWTPGIYWPSSIAGSMTEVILLKVVRELQREFDISDR